MTEERNRLSRWSERKVAARRGEALPEPADEVPPAQPVALDPDGNEPDQAAVAEGAPDEDMPALPSLDELNAESDYTVFLNKKVPETLRRAALRKLWTSDPVLANLDGLNDYDHDYNVIDTVITAAQTAYRAGRGYVDEIKEKLDEVEQALGDDGDPESKKLAGSGEAADDSSANPEADSLRADSVNQESVSDSDAAGDNSADAPRQVAAASPSLDPAHPRETGGE